MIIKKKIACLPVAGPENPYQSLMIKGLNEAKDIHAFTGVDDKFLGIIRTYLKYRPSFIHFDWIVSYYLRRKLYLTLLLLPLFYIQIIYVRFFTKTKIVWTLHNIIPHDASHIWLHKFTRRFFSKQTSYVRVFSSETIKTAIAKLRINSKKIKVIPEGDYTAVYPDNVSQQVAREYLKIKKDKIVLLSLGYIKPYKGIEKLIAGFLRVNNPGAELLIAGKASNENYVKQLKSLIGKSSDNRITIINKFIPVNELQFFYNAADVVILPFNKIENSGSVIMAMGFKKAILAPKLGVLVKRLENQKFLLYDNLHEGLNLVLDTKQKKLESLGVKNYRALKQYKWKDFSELFV